MRTAIGLVAAGVAVFHLFDDSVATTRCLLILLASAALAGVAGFTSLPRGRPGDPSRRDAAARTLTLAVMTAGVLLAVVADRQRVRRMSGPGAAPGSAVVCVDFGSTFTKAALVDLERGAIVAAASHPTTLPTPTAR